MHSFQLVRNMAIHQNGNHNMIKYSTNINVIHDLEPKQVLIPVTSSDLPPLVRALKASAERNSVAFNFPGHRRGEAAPSALTHLIGTLPFLHDVTEMPELDNFYSPKGPLLEAKKLAAELFGAKETWFLVGGTSCGVQAAVMATCSPGDTIILPRNAHVSATMGIIFSGAVPKYMLPQHNADWDIAAGIMPSQVSPILSPGELITEKALNYLKLIKSRGGFIIGAADPRLNSIVVCKEINDR